MDQPQPRNQTYLDTVRRIILPAFVTAITASGMELTLKVLTPSTKAITGSIDFIVRTSHRSIPRSPLTYSVSSVGANASGDKAAPG